MRYRGLSYLAVVTMLSACAQVPPRQEDPVDRLSHVIRDYMASRLVKTFPIEQRNVVAFAAARGISLKSPQLQILTWQTGDTFLLIRYSVPGRAGPEDGMISFTDGPP
ncbi:MAG: hypothetical protein QOJ45_1111 [Verrucomicrobiota bacterium]|jgi:hypothetical protein